VVCPNCQTINPDQARFCMNCGHELVQHCSSCHAELARGARFCMACGQPVLLETATDADRLSRLTAAVPDDLVQKLRSASLTSLRRPSGTLGEQRTITCLLIDVVGSTALTASLGMDVWTQVIDHAFEQIAPLIYRYEGTIVRSLGDSLLAFFGAPVAHEDDPARAVRAGIEIIDQMKAFASEVRHRYHVDWVMRACVNTGPIVIGPLADDLTYDFTNDSPTVNLTSRIKFASNAMNVLITGNTYRFIAPYFDLEELGPVEVRGQSETVQVYRVRAARTDPGSIRGFRDLGSPMVGREKELTTLYRMCETVRAGLGRAVLIVGEPGLGKTRLIQEWKSKAGKEQADDSGKTACEQWLTGRCTSYSQGIAYRLLNDILRDLLGVTIASTEVETHQALTRLTHDLLGEEWMHVYPYLGRLLSLKLEGQAALLADINDPQALQMQYLQAVQHLFLAHMKRQPLILVLEDLHWADGASTELFIKLLPLIASGPVLFCLVTRPERNTAGWKLVSAARELLGNSLTEIDLNPLSEGESRTLVANLLELESLPGQLRDLILHKAEGNPYFVEEVIRMLIERGTITHQEGAWVAKQEISEHEIPDNLQGLLLARIDRLPPEARYTLLVASVIGRNFPVRVLSEVMGEV
jgi:class 3 adenylate cyclase